MRMMSLDEAIMVTGAGNLQITQVISTEGIPDACLAVLVPSIQAAIATTITRDEMIAQITGSCTSKDLEIFSDRIDDTLPIRIEYI